MTGLQLVLAISSAHSSTLFIRRTYVLADEWNESKRHLESRHALPRHSRRLRVHHRYEIHFILSQILGCLIVGYTGRALEVADVAVLDSSHRVRNSGMRRAISRPYL